MLTARTAAALLLANIRYWLTVAPRVGSQLDRWQAAARAIPDSGLREVALAKLVDERFNVEVAATLATLAPKPHRDTVVEAIVALQVLYDYLDVLGEQPNSDGERLFRAFTDAVAVGAAVPSEPIEMPVLGDVGYIDHLSHTVIVALTSLPACNAIAQVAQAAAMRCADAQILNHAEPTTGTAPLEQWASAQAEAWTSEEEQGTAFGWQEFLAGASASVLSIHALITAAADPGTRYEDAVAIDAAYLSIGALTMLDSVVDYQDDLDEGRPGYVQYYDDLGLLASRLTFVSRDARARAGLAPHAAHHTMTLVGVAAYYLSDPRARSDFARPILAGVHDELRPLIIPTLALMRGWRAAKRLRR